MLPSKRGRAASKPAGVQRQASASTLRQSSVERHRQSYIRAWNAINQAKQEAAIQSVLEENDGQHHQIGKPNQSDQSTPRLNQSASISISNARLGEKFTKPTKERNNSSQICEAITERQKKSSNVNKATQMGKASNVPGTPEPTRGDEDSSNSDDSSSQVSGSGLFVTPNVNATRHGHASPDRPHSQRLIPFPGRKSRRELVLVFCAPDSPKVDEVTKAKLKVSSRKAFGPKAVRKVYQTTPGVWLVKLRSQEEARDGAGRGLFIGGVHIVAEKTAKVPSKVFIWKSEGKDDMPDNVEITDSIRQTFDWPTPEVEVRDSPRQATLTFSQCPQLLRLYLPLTGGGFARFEPVPPAR